MSTATTPSLMSFSTALNYLFRGHRIKLPEWGGFWYYDEKSDTVLMFTRKGAVIDIRQTEDMRYTLTFMGRNDWQYVTDDMLENPCLEVWQAFDPKSRSQDRDLAIASVCHAVNRAYCQAHGDDSHPTWVEAPEWQKASLVFGVQMHLANPDATPADSHESWMRQKLADGWTYGEVKDTEAKTHPCMMPYDQLPMEQRAKDYLFRATVHSVAKVMGV